MTHLKLSALVALLATGTLAQNATDWPSWYSNYGYDGEPFVPGDYSEQDGTKWLDKSSVPPCDLTLKTNMSLLIDCPDYAPPVDWQPVYDMRTLLGRVGSVRGSDFKFGTKGVDIAKHKLIQLDPDPSGFLFKVARLKDTFNFGGTDYVCRPNSTEKSPGNFSVNPGCKFSRELYAHLDTSSRINDLSSPDTQPNWLYYGAGNGTVTPKQWKDAFLPAHIKGLFDTIKGPGKSFSTDVLKDFISHRLPPDTEISIEHCLADDAFPATTHADGGGAFLGKDLSWVQVALSAARDTDLAGLLMYSDRETGDLDQVKTKCQFELFKQWKKLGLDGLALQMKMTDQPGGYVEPAKFSAFLDAMQEAGGLVEVTEAAMKLHGDFDDDDYRFQASIFGGLWQACLEHKNCVSFSFLATYDGFKEWPAEIQDSHPVLWAKSFQPKIAYWEICARTIAWLKKNDPDFDSKVAPILKGGAHN